MSKSPGTSRGFFVWHAANARASETVRSVSADTRGGTPTAASD